VDEAADHAPRAAWRAGLRAGVPFAIAAFLLSLSFGVLAREAGLSALATIAMSAIVFAGSAQFAAISIISAGGSIGSAVGAAALMNSRFLPMGAALAPSLPGRALKRALQGQTVVDASWALAIGPDGKFNRWLLFGCSAIQYVAWILGTAVGALSGNVLGDPAKLGLDAIFPAFFLALLVGEVRSRSAATAAVLGGLIALALVPVAPPGVPVLAAAFAALVGIFRRRGAA
jgi:4-azaleucine resistance transporter AzlC